MNENNNENESQRYKYIGYSEDFPIDKEKYTYSQDLLMKLARESVRKRDYYHAIRYLNMILIKNPKNFTAIFYKKQVLNIIAQMRRNNGIA